MLMARGARGAAGRGRGVSGSNGAGVQLTCTIVDCHRPYIARGLCNTHYVYWKRRGDPEAPRIAKGRPWTVRELAKVRKLLDETPGGIGRVPMGSATELAEELGRSPDAVRGKILTIRKWRRVRMDPRDLLAISAQDARYS